MSRADSHIGRKKPGNVPSVPVFSNTQNYGIHIDARYQVKDQNGAAIQSAAMIPQENVNVNNGGWSGWGDIGPNVDMTTEFTNSDGTYHDAPVGICASSSFSNYPVAQQVQIDINSGDYSVRTNNFTVSGSSAGHGSISNGSDISQTR